MKIKKKMILFVLLLSTISPMFNLAAITQLEKNLQQQEEKRKREEINKSLDESLKENPDFFNVFLGIFRFIGGTLSVISDIVNSFNPKMRKNPNSGQWETQGVNGHYYT